VCGASEFSFSVIWLLCAIIYETMLLEEKPAALVNNLVQKPVISFSWLAAFTTCSRIEVINYDSVRCTRDFWVI